MLSPKGQQGPRVHVEPIQMFGEEEFKTPLGHEIITRGGKLFWLVGGFISRTID